MSEIPASIQNITPECRFNRGTVGALTEALSRIEAAYFDCVDVPDNQQVTWRISLVRVEVEAPVEPSGPELTPHPPAHSQDCGILGGDACDCGALS